MYFNFLKNARMALLVLAVGLSGIQSVNAANLAGLKKVLALETAPSYTEYVNPHDVVSERRYGKTRLKPTDFEKAKRLFLKIKSENIGRGQLSLGDFESVVLYVKAYRSGKKKLWFHKSGDAYVHPDHQRLKIPLQFLSNGQVYLHFKSFDPGKKKGGYKTFSRSLDFDSEEMYANLVVRILRKKDGLNILDELKIMDELREVSSALTFRDVALYVGHSETALPGVLVRKISIITPLYDHDLGVYFEHKPALLHGVWLALKAARSLNQLHENGYVHRDVKPGNFFIRGSHGSFGFVVADFGLSEHFQDEEFGRKLSGTRGYMAPEICSRRVNQEPSFRSLSDGIDADLFSLGMTFYSLLKGRRNSLRTLLTDLNSIALPRDKSVTPDKNIFASRLNAYRTEYKHSRPSRYREISANDQALYSYEMALWQLLTPEQENRITLEEFIVRLEEVLDLMNVKFVS